MGAPPFTFSMKAELPLFTFSVKKWFLIFPRKSAIPAIPAMVAMVSFLHWLHLIFRPISEISGFSADFLI